MPRKCPECGKRHIPTCERTCPECGEIGNCCICNEGADSCLNCGTDAEALFEHPDTIDDRLCKECLISFREDQIEEHKSEIECLKKEIKRLKGLKTK